MGEEVKSKEQPKTTLATERIEEILQADSPDFEEILQVHAVALYSRRARKAVEKILETIRGKGKPKAVESSVRIGAALWLLGSYREAHEYLQNTRTNISGAYFLGVTLKALGRYGEAVEILEKTAKRKTQSEAVQYALVEALIANGSATDARKALRDLEKTFGKNSSTGVLRGRILDLTGDHEGARETYRKVADADPECGEALFRLAFSMDLYGDDDEAIELYTQCAALPQPNVNALVNLGVLHEDRGENHKAIEYYETVLKSYPNHARAQAFLKDALSSLEEVVDEERARMEDRRWQTLQIPITDFELSVRSRNCLNKMKIRTLGDLVQKTEAELLSYKNFGETSLGEIKLILESKNLRLGINLDDLKKGEKKKRLDDLFMKGGEEDDIAQKPIADLGLSIRSRKCMEVLDLGTIGDLMIKSEKELLACKNFGQTSLLEVKRKLAEQGVSLSESAPDEAVEEEA
jgi:DNA-directed RNA polymerase subunit alpha